MGLAPIPTGGILFRNREYLESMSIETPYLTEDRQSTIVGTRTGASTAATWALLKHLGREGYRKIATRCMELTHYLAEGIGKAGFELITEPELNIVAFRSSKLTMDEISNGMVDRGWLPSISAYPKAIRIIIMPHIKKEHLENFLADLKSIN
jgi:tyrosine decarboxylase/aspartate 1-decarboxylase